MAYSPVLTASTLWPTANGLPLSSEGLRVTAYVPCRAQCRGTRPRSRFGFSTSQGCCRAGPASKLNQVVRAEEARLRRLLRVYGVRLAPYWCSFAADVDPLALKVLSFWFGMHYDGVTVPAEQYHLWFGKSSETDMEISCLFEDHVLACSNGAYDHWAAHPLGLLAQVILMDQFPRNIFRNMARSFSCDWKVQCVTYHTIFLLISPHMPTANAEDMCRLEAPKDASRRPFRCCLPIGSSRRRPPSAYGKVLLRINHPGTLVF